MTSMLKASRFIFMVAKPYYRRFLLPMIFIIVIVVTALQTSQSSPVFVCGFAFLLLFFLSMLMCVYPFYASDRVPQVFSVLPQRKVDLVRGIYFNYLTFLTCVLLIGLAVLSIFRIADVSASGLLFVLGIMCVFVSLILGIELPVIFQIGFAKIQMLFNLIYVVIGFLPTILIKTFHQESNVAWLLSHRAQLDNPLYFGGCIVATVLLIAVSYRISLTVYRRKDI
jgi:hypothetical protein